jgi:two-component system sensor histidine kinase KdpD
MYSILESGKLMLERAWVAQAESRAQILEESDRLKSAIFPSVSNELGTPRATIKTATSSLRDQEVSWGGVQTPQLPIEPEVE